jgi:predicted dehydrogenase
VKRIGMGLVGAGFIGPHHLEAVRRLGFVDVVAIADFNDELAKQKAEALGVPKSYGSYQALLADPDVHVVHNATPNYMHHPVSMAAIAAGKHIVSDKPLAMTSAQARELLDAATAKGVVHAVTFNYRGNPLVQQARAMIQKGEIGPPRFIHGQYLQDWLLLDTDYSWRLEPDKGGESSAMGDIGSHWCDLAQHVSGLRITHVLADLRSRAARGWPSRRRAPTMPTRRWTSRSRICAPCWCGSRTARRAHSRSGRCARDTRTTCGSRSTAAPPPYAGTRSSRTSSGSGTVPRAT